MVQRVDTDDRHASVLYRFEAQSLNFDWPQRHISGLTVKRLLDQDRHDIEVVLRNRHGEKVIGDHDEVDLAEDGLEHFFLREVHHQITIEVDGEPYEPPRREMTPDETVVLGRRGRPCMGNSLSRARLARLRAS
jgi:hypothetical protein